MKLTQYLILVLILFMGCSPKCNYLVSPNGKYYLTLFEKTDKAGKNYTLITYGRTNVKKMPTSYIQVRNRYFDAWYCLISWEGSKVVVYQPYSDFSGHNLGNEMELKKMQSKEFSKIFFSAEKDHYIRLSSYNKDTKCL